jgi:secreted trypsin-like serine protease
VLIILILILVLIAIVLGVYFYYRTQVIYLPIEGEDAAPRELRWAVHLMIDAGGAKLQCAGAIVDQDWVLTAAHCIPDPGAPEKVTAHLLTTDLSSPTIPDVQFDRIIVREGFSGRLSEGHAATYSNDLALLRFKLGDEEMADEIRRYFATLKIVPLTPEEHLEHANARKAALLAGWGETETGDASRTLKKANVQIISFSECKDAYGDAVNEAMVCVRPLTAGGRAAFCRGDSGGPLMVSDGASWRLAGIASWRHGDCLNARMPSVYVRTDTIDEWVARTIGQSAAVNAGVSP